MIFKNKYKNPWAKDLSIQMPEFYENNAPIHLEYRGVIVYKLREKSFDFVLDGCCITQRAGAKKTEQVKKIFPHLKSYKEFN